jgi:hypothetical protein
LRFTSGKGHQVDHDVPCAVPSVAEEGDIYIGAGHQNHFRLCLELEPHPHLSINSKLQLKLPAAHFFHLLKCTQCLWVSEN